MTGVEQPSVTRLKRSREPLKLGILLGAMYFVQGIGEPTEGLIAQPVRSLLKSWGHTAGEITTFCALLALPWSLKPLYGLLTDFVPLARTRRRNYLLVSTAIAVIGMAYLSVYPPVSGQSRLLFWALLVPTFGVAFSDVVVDALMIERGQPLGITGRLQSIQWAAIYSATILVGFVGGYVSQTGRPGLGFMICGTAMTVTLLLTWFMVREEPTVSPKGSFRHAAKSLWTTAKSPAVLGAGTFIFLWNFNPFSTTVLYLHMSGELGFSEQFCGTTVSMIAIGAVVASVAYGTYCRRVRFERLIHVAIVAGILNTIAYWLLSNETSAILISLSVGFSYMTGTLIQLDLAARMCRVETAGTTFALLMALSNLSMSLSTGFGGWLYERWTRDFGHTAAFNILVGVGAMFTAVCWLIVPFLKRLAISSLKTSSLKTNP